MEGGGGMSLDLEAYPRLLTVDIMAEREACTYSGEEKYTAENTMFISCRWLSERAEMEAVVEILTPRNIVATAGKC
ncbi:hypothetical protein J6590_095610 [Homalodisca vitripennis]|nr:hypothetical protein J6590_069527 [Homalodisca vitripennis]KAG8284772.1 hypothetical protein J6590_095610 [Homalodisca vitripennis]